MATPVEVRAPSGAVRLELVWDDGRITGYDHRVLRALCPCAHCQGHQGPIEWVEATDALTHAQLELEDVFEVGQYALGLVFRDGHSTGIYTFSYLEKLAEAESLDEAARRALRFER